MGWSRACYVELVRRADTAAFIQCHVNAFEYLGGVPRRCLYDNAKVITLGRDEEKRPVWNERMLDFALRVGFELRLCRPYRAQTKGKVESGVKYVRRNMWPSIRFTDDADLNRQGLEWCDTVANRRIHGTTHRVPGEMLAEERPHLGKLPVFSVNYFCRFRQLFLPVHLLFLVPFLSHSGSIAGDVEFQDDRVVDHPVDGRRSDHGVGEDMLPLGEDQIGGDAQGATLVAFGDEGEEHLRFLGTLGQVAQVVQQQEVVVVELA